MRSAEQLLTSYRGLERKTTEVKAINEELVREVGERRRIEAEVSRLNESLREQLAEVERAQAQLIQTEKLATMGSLLAGVAHELNNPLSVLLGQATLLMNSAKDKALADRGEKIMAAAQRCARVVRNFLALARKQAPERRSLHVNPVVQEAAELLAYELRTGSVEVILSLAENLPSVEGDPHRLHQVILNLMSNAAYAMRRAPGPRRLQVTTRAIDDRRRVQVVVADSGPGIPPEIRGRIFEPFFTTKPEGEGTGLGLPLCKGVVEEHGGTISLVSESGPGATFLIELPAEAVEPARLEREPSQPSGPKAILVIDDEREITTILAELLEQDGHHVDTADDGAVALEMLERQAYDLIVSDTKMPRLDGIDFFRRAIETQPRLARRVIFLTGDTLSDDKLKFLERLHVPVLAKPFDLEEVLRVVRETLAR